MVVVIRPLPVAAVSSKTFEMPSPYFEGNISLEEAAELLKQQTRRYAKRQLTWFRRDTRINWLYPDLSNDVFSEAENYVSEFLKE